MSAGDKIAHAVLNTRSLEGGDPAEDAALLLTLGEAFLALRQAVAVYDEGRVLACVPMAVYELSLPSGTRIRAALGAFQRTSREMLHD
jgi:hypothetical protein